MITDVAAWTREHCPKWNPMNVCSYHLQEAGADAGTGAFLRAGHRHRGARRSPRQGARRALSRPWWAGISFFVNAGIRFVTELCKMRAFTELWDEICRERYGVEDERFRRFRYGVQVNSLGLTEQQPENNVTRILIEMLAVTLSKNARARAVQLSRLERGPRPAPPLGPAMVAEDAAGPRLRDRPSRIRRSSSRETRRSNGARRSSSGPPGTELLTIDAMGGGGRRDSKYMKSRPSSRRMRQRISEIETGETVVVGVNRYVEAEPSPLTTGEGRCHGRRRRGRGPTRSPGFEAWRAGRDAARVKAALTALREAARTGANIMPPIPSKRRARGA